LFNRLSGGADIQKLSTVDGTRAKLALLGPPVDLEKAARCFTEIGEINRVNVLGNREKWYDFYSQPKHEILGYENLVRGLAFITTHNLTEHQLKLARNRVLGADRIGKAKHLPYGVFRTDVRKYRR